MARGADVSLFTAVPAQGPRGAGSRLPAAIRAALLAVVPRPSGVRPRQVAAGSDDCLRGVAVRRDSRRAAVHRGSGRWWVGGLRTVAVDSPWPAGSRARASAGALGGVPA